MTKDEMGFLILNFHLDYDYGYDLILDKPFDCFKKMQSKLCLIIYYSNNNTNNTNN